MAFMSVWQGPGHEQLLVKRITKMSICTNSYEDNVCVHKISCLICCHHLQTFQLNKSANEVCSQVSRTRYY